MDTQNLAVIPLIDTERSKIVDLIHNIKKETPILLGTYEAYQIFMAVRGTEKIEGDTAEVGVYRGGSARLICEAKGNRALHLFDTFEGMPEKGNSIRAWARTLPKGELAASLEEVQHTLRKFSNVNFYRGLFPSTVDPVKDRKFSFAHFDVDFYESTCECLNFFYPRMSKGGIIISHDYFEFQGVRKAFDEFFKSKPEPVIPISGSQCLVKV
jgi:hypothetical protein